MHEYKRYAGVNGEETDSVIAQTKNGTVVISTRCKKCKKAKYIALSENEFKVFEEAYNKFKQLDNVKGAKQSKT